MSSNLHDLLLNKRACVQCPTSPSCPSCGSDEQCSFTVQTCIECPKAICIKAPASSTTTTHSPAPSSTNHTNTGAIAGGVVGGLVVFFSLVAFLVWKYVYSAKARQRRLEQEVTYEEDLTKTGREFYAGEKRDQSRRGTQYSTTTISSSNTANGGGNVIPIAYIPGVFSRTQDAASSDKAYSEKYFSASDILRNSQYSHRPGSGIRSSIATTNYRGSIAFASDPIEVSEARPNLVNVENNQIRPLRLTIDTNKYFSGASSMESPIVASAQTIDVQASRRMNAKSVRIGKSATGLQNQFIIEEASEEEHDEENANEEATAKSSVDDKESDNSIKDLKIEKKSTKTIIDDNYSDKTDTPSMLLNLRQSTFSDFDIKFEDNENSKNQRSQNVGVSRSVSSSSASRRTDDYPTDKKQVNLENKI